jgi:hypothetical protein
LRPSHDVTADHMSNFRGLPKDFNRDLNTGLAMVIADTNGRVGASEASA